METTSPVGGQRSLDYSLQILLADTRRVGRSRTECRMNKPVDVKPLSGHAEEIQLDAYKSFGRYSNSTLAESFSELYHHGESSVTWASLSYCPCSSRNGTHNHLLPNTNH